MLHWFLRRRWGRWALLVAAISAFVVGMGALECVSCYSMWDASGMPVAWGPLSGCRVKTEGHWIPTTAFRKVP